MEYQGVKDYPVELPAFDGPLDLLLYLIRKDKIDIYDIPIESVTDQYMKYLYHAQQFNLQLGTEFFELAATLLAIKARMLLPKSADEEEQDPREELVSRLEEWKRVLYLKDVIEEGFRAHEDYLERPPTTIRSVRFKGDLSWQRLQRVWERLQEIERTEETAVLIGESVSAAEVEKDMLTRISQGSVHLLQYFMELPSRLYRITAFLIVLELVKQNRMTIGEDIDGIFIAKP